MARMKRTPKTLAERAAQYIAKLKIKDGDPIIQTGAQHFIANRAWLAGYRAGRTDARKRWQELEACSKPLAQIRAELKDARKKQGKREKGKS